MRDCHSRRRLLTNLLFREIILLFRSCLSSAGTHYNESILDPIYPINTSHPRYELVMLSHPKHGGHSNSPMDSMRSRDQRRQCSFRHKLDDNTYERDSTQCSGYNKLSQRSAMIAAVIDRPIPHRALSATLR